MEEQNLRLQEEAKQYVHSMGRWYKFFGILSIVGCAFMVLGAIMMMTVGNVSAGYLLEGRADGSDGHLASDAPDRVLHAILVREVVERRR